MDGFYANITDVFSSLGAARRDIVSFAQNEPRSARYMGVVHRVSSANRVAGAVEAGGEPYLFFVAGDPSGGPPLHLTQAAWMHRAPLLAIVGTTAVALHGAADKANEQ